jgi:hypothetical protein
MFHVVWIKFLIHEAIYLIHEANHLIHEATGICLIQDVNYLNHEAFYLIHDPNKNYFFNLTKPKIISVGTGITEKNCYDNYLIQYGTSQIIWYPVGKKNLIDNLTHNLVEFSRFL